MREPWRRSKRYLHDKYAVFRKRNFTAAEKRLVKLVANRFYHLAETSKTCFVRLQINFDEEGQKEVFTKL